MGRTETPPPQPQPYQPSPITHHNYVILPPYYPPRPSLLSRVASFSFSVLLPVTIFAIALFFLWPSKPDLQLARLRLDHISLSPKRSSSSPILPAIAIDITLDLTIKVHNRDFFSLDYRSINVSIGYRGRRLGFVTSSGGHVRARGTSYVNATLRLDGVEVLHDVLYLLDDMVKGLIPFDSVTEIKGQLGLLFFDFPIQATVSCEVYVNTDNQTVIHQDCYPE